MRNFTKLALITAIVYSGSTAGGEIYLDLDSFGGNTHDAARFLGGDDADSMTGIFTEFGFNALLATSIYDFSNGSLLGSFYDTNIAEDLVAAGMSAAGTSGTALDGLSDITIPMPDCAAGQCDIDALSPLVPPLTSDNEGFLQTWDLQVEYYFEGTLSARGPRYTGGTLDVYFNSLIDDTLDGLAFSATLTGSHLTAGNLNVFFDITSAADSFLNISNGSSYVDVASFIDDGYFPQLTIDTNVHPPMPTPAQMLWVDGSAIRTTHLDGSVTAYIPEPGSIALIGLGLFGLLWRKEAKHKV